MSHLQQGWVCNCGTQNHAGRSKCHRCKNFRFNSAVQIAPVTTQAKYELQTWKCNCGTTNETNRVNCLRCRAPRMAGQGPQHPYSGVQPVGNRTAAIGRTAPPQGGVLPKLKGVTSPEMDQIEKEFQDITNDRGRLATLWNRIDYNGNGIVSLAEVDKLVVERYPQLDHKPALMRAFKWACSAAGGGDGDDWVEKKEFRTLLSALVFYNRIFKVFLKMDGGEAGDRRIDLNEFVKGCEAMQLRLTRRDAEGVFQKLDANGGGYILFDEFCAWCVHNKMRQSDPFSY